ncbi:MAG: serine hydrolase domain-containing protein [Ramlibacter sp.]
MQPAESTATHANWRQAPHNRWAFRNIDRILPVATIAHDPARVSPLPVATRSLESLRIELPGGPLPWGEFLRQTHTDALAVLLDGQLVHEWMDAGMTEATPHIVMSASKSVVGLLCGALAHQGVLDPEAPVAHYVPEVAASPFQGATVRQLLDMRTQPGFTPPELQQYAQSTNWDPGASAGGLHAFFAGLPARAGAHGGAFRYLSANTDLLGWVIERAAGQPFAQVASQSLWRHLGAGHDATITLDRAGAPRPTGGWSMTLRDFARVGQFLLEPGRHGPFADFVPAWLDDVLANGDAQAWAQGDFAAGFGRRMHYRSGWYVLREEPRLLFAMGIHGQHLFVDPARRLVVAKLSSQPQPQDAQAIGWTLRAVGALRRVL